jgi:hypothetical protein
MFFFSRGAIKHETPEDEVEAIPLIVKFAVKIEKPIMLS